ncbi:MAG: alpha-ketoglutarate-dependent dioxygenase AlkB [Deltaproteobacteria bacterium]|nr:alpha-ketoglutarate-dependent dioxygenase AlkB [Deltaproteobacteria bacterium]
MISMTDEFRRYVVPAEDDLFEQLLASARFEHVTRGRQGTVLVAPDDTRGIPIVRTTTRYDAPAQCFKPVHSRLAQQIRELASLPLAFNNALIEVYGNAYTRMGFHSDQALDLEAGSVIAVFSCYRVPDRANPPRALVVQSKQPSGDVLEIPLTHHSVVVFSLDTNRRFRHKIVLDRSLQPPENQWLGVTFRTSGTFVRPSGERMHFEDGEPLTLADDDQRRAFYELRRRENQETSFTYPRLTYTISESDLMRPRH